MMIFPLHLRINLLETIIHSDLKKHPKLKLQNATSINHNTNSLVVLNVINTSIRNVNMLKGKFRILKRLVDFLTLLQWK
ncbi:unnamed protein product [Trichobilharzia szidati]|nr:unnamed protein product [Trichobilharzia szidati]